MLKFWIFCNAIIKAHLYKLNAIFSTSTYFNNFCTVCMYMYFVINTYFIFFIIFFKQKCTKFKAIKMLN